MKKNQNNILLLFSLIIFNYFYSPVVSSESGTLSGGKTNEPEDDIKQLKERCEEAGKKIAAIKDLYSRIDELRKEQIALQEAIAAKEREKRSKEAAKEEEERSREAEKALKIKEVRRNCK